MMVSNKVLVHSTAGLSLVLACDASFFGVGVVISHMCDECEQLICYASRTLRDSELNYAQLDKEALYIMYGVHKFRLYLLGRHFTIYTNHKWTTTCWDSGLTA